MDLSRFRVYEGQMVARQNPKRKKLTDAERHERFVETARAVQASDDPKDFDRAFKKVVRAPTKTRP